MRAMLGLLIAICITLGIVGFSFLEGQQMDEEQTMKLMKEFVALVPNEVPGFDTKGGIVYRRDYRWEPEKYIMFIQGLSRKGEGVPGKDPTEIVIRASLLPDRNIAYQAAILETTTQLRYPDGAGMPEGSWTGLPIGEKSWATAPKTGPGVSFTSGLVFWDDKLAVKVLVRYPPLDPKARNLIFFPIEQEDLESGELAARLILAKASLVLLGWDDLPKLRLVVNGSSLQAREHQGNFFVPVTSTLNRLGVNWERKVGAFVFSWRGRKVTLPIGSRMALVGRWKVRKVEGMGARRLVEAEGTVRLSHPVLFDGKEYWVDGEGFAKALGWRVRRSGGMVTLAP